MTTKNQRRLMITIEGYLATWLEISCGMCEWRSRAFGLVLHIDKSCDRVVIFMSYEHILNILGNGVLIVMFI